MQSTRSSTHFPIGPKIGINVFDTSQSNLNSNPYAPLFEILLEVGLKPYNPHQPLGILVLPKRSLPIARGTDLVATIPPEPPEDPPVVLCG